MADQVDTQPQRSNPIVSANADTWLSKFYRKISDQLQDLTYVEVITMSSTSASAVTARIDTSAPDVLKEIEEKQMKLLARTKIELDGDILVILPMLNGEATVNKEILNIHKENVTVAVQNWNSFLNMIIEVIKVFADLAGMPRKDIFDKFVIDTRVPDVT